MVSLLLMTLGLLEHWVDAATGTGVHQIELYILLPPNFQPWKQTRAFNIVSIASIVLIIIWMFGCFLAVLLICPGHVGDYWGPSSVRAQHCWTTTKFLYAFSWSDVGTDLIVLLFPVSPVGFYESTKRGPAHQNFQVLHLHIPTQKKIAIVAIFGLGALYDHNYEPSVVGLCWLILEQSVLLS